MVRAGHNGPVLTPADGLALRELLAARGRTWEPLPGDRFVIPDRDLDTVFVVADMTIEVEELPTGRLVRFNGTTEWALDSIAADDVCWLPWEHQLRDLLGSGFASLQALPAPGGGYAVELSDGRRFIDVDPESAYLRALLAG